MNYIDDNLILVDGTIWNALSETQKAALLIHESTYQFTVKSLLGVAILNHNTALVQAMIKASQGKIGEGTIAAETESHWFGSNTIAYLNAKSLADQLGFGDISALFFQ